jgi:hypothetical protein
MAGMDLNAFLGHSATVSGRSEYLNKWKKNTPPQVDVWLHTQALIQSLWQHGIPRLFEKEDKESGDKTVEVWSGTWPCWEAEEVLQKQYMRDHDTGERAFPPCVCPVCKLIEYVRDAVESGELKWTAPLFRFAGSDPSKTLIIHAGGMYNAFGKDNLSEKEKDELKTARIYRTDAWRENMMAKLSYVFSVVDNAKPQKGPQIAIETSLLGDKVKEVINNAMMEAEDEGNPLANPYAIRWIYRADETQFNKKYNAVKMGKLPLTAEIRKAIYDTPPPDLSKVVGRKDPNVLLAQLQDAHKAYSKKFELPLEELFADAIEEWSKRGDDGFNPDEYEAEDKAPKAKAQAPKAQAPKAKAKTTLCYECGEFTDGGKCDNCGYDPLASPAATADADDDLPY